MGLGLDGTDPVSVEYNRECAKAAVDRFFQQGVGESDAGYLARCEFMMNTCFERIMAAGAAKAPSLAAWQSKKAPSTARSSQAAEEKAEGSEVKAEMEVGDEVKAEDGKEEEAAEASEDDDDITPEAEAEKTGEDEERGFALKEKMPWDLTLRPARAAPKAAERAPMPAKFRRGQQGQRPRVRKNNGARKNKALRKLRRSDGEIEVVVFFCQVELILHLPK